MTSEVANPALTGDVVVVGKACMTSVPWVVSIESVVVSDSPEEMSRIFSETRILLCVRCMSLGNIVCGSLGATVRLWEAGLVSAPVLMSNEVAIPDVSVGKVLAAE